MSGNLFICGMPDRCVKHDRPLHGYPCYACQTEWEQANPRTVAAITAFANGKGSVARYRAAQKADMESVVAAAQTVAPLPPEEETQQ